MSRMVEYPQAESLLAAHGLPLVESTLVYTLGEAQSWASQIGFPVCLKINSTAIAHRSDVEGVILDIRDPSQLSQAFSRLIDRLDIQTDGLLLQRMIPSGLELIVGVKWDPTFGHVIMLGAGGVLAEMLAQVAIRPLPLNRTDALDMISGINQRGLLDGYRDLAAVDRESLASLLLGVSSAVQANPWIDQLDLNPVIADREGLHVVDLLLYGVEETRRAASTRRFPPESLRPFFHPRSVAVIGASRNPTKGGHVIVKNLARFAFPGQVFPINPNADEILGFRCYPDLTQVPDEVDLAVGIVPKDQMPTAIQSCVDKGVKAAIVVTAGYSDTGPEGAEQEQTIRRALHDAGIRLMGPNSIGTISPSAGLATSITTLHPIRPGHVSIVGQTGVLASGLANHIATLERFGLARVACIGNRADVDECDVLEYLLADPDTEVIGMYLEGIRDGRRFMELLERARDHKRLVVIKAGRSEEGARAVSSHTGALAVDDRIFDGICRKYGVIRAFDLEQMMDLLKFYALVPPTSAKTLGVLSITGMGCVLTADLAAPMGFGIPPFQESTKTAIRLIMPAWAPLHNPCDLWSTIEANGPETAYRQVGLAILDDPGIESLFLIFLLIDESDFDPGPMADELLAHAGKKPIFAAILGGEKASVESWQTALESRSIPTYPGLQRALGAAAAALNLSNGPGF
ncbi:MAG: acetate--CoA ligase family protein [Bradymonadales bacterium]|nr:acetate--CoA ligase family protein [Bradymonadales bacterium]